ncbi:MAG: putative toxin-antitoxin system toxin component, PIN family [Gammaproteobacteria bacterium]|nr:putative toxin-antitoxin system toxin component, PIN family [Gammaproteobacteria bacterium]
MKVVFDTNVLVSALALPGGRADEATRRIVEGEDSLALSKPGLDEFLSVLARKLDHDREALAHVAVFLFEMAEFVEPTESLTVLADEPDNRILECALAAGAQLVVTGDRAMLAQGDCRGVRIVSLSTYLA